MYSRALVLSAALVLGACLDPTDNPLGPFSGGVGPPAGADGASDTTTSCANCGTLEIVTERQGAAPYSTPHVNVWDGTGWDWLVTLPASGTSRTSLLQGSYWVSLDLPPNCAGHVDGGGEVQIVAGDTTHVAVTLDCEPAGTLGLSVAVSEGDAPQDITVKLHRQDAPGTWETLLPLGRPGRYIVLAGDWTAETEVPDHCETTGVEPASFSVAEGAIVDVAIALRCDELTGMLRVTTSTSGGDAHLVLHTGGECLYSFSEDTWSFTSSNCFDLAPTGARAFHLTRGAWTVWVSHEGATCAVLPSDSVTVEIVGGETTELAVTATCD